MASRMPTTGALFVTNPLAVRINRGHPRWRNALRNETFKKFEVPTYKQLRAKYGVAPGAKMPQAALEERWAASRKAKQVVRGVTSDATARGGHRKAHTKTLTGQARHATGVARKTKVTRGGKPTRLSLSGNRPPWMAGYRAALSGKAAKAPGRTRKAKAPVAAKQVANPLYRVLSGIAVKVNPFSGLAVRTNPYRIVSNPYRIVSNPYRTLGGLAIRTNPAVSLPGTSLVQRAVGHVPVVGGIVGQALPAAVGMVLGFGGYALYQMSPMPGWVAMGMDKVVGMLPDSVEGAARKGLGALTHVSGTLTGASIAYGVYKINGMTAKSPIVNGIATAVAVAGATIDMVRALTPLLAKYGVKLPINVAGIDADGHVLADGMAYEVVPLSGEDVDALQGIAVAYSDANLGDAWYSGADFSVDEGQTLLAGPRVWRAQFQPAINRTNVTGRGHSRHAGQRGHKWGWLIKWVGWENAAKIAALPPDERLETLKQLRDAAMAQAAQLVNRTDGVGGGTRSDDAYAGVVGSFGDPQLGGFIYTGQTA